MDPGRADRCNPQNLPLPATAPSYRDALSGPKPKTPFPATDNTPMREALKPSDPPLVSTLFSDQIRDQASPLRSHKGEPAIFISNAEETAIADPFKYTLIGKFSWGRPAMVIIRKVVQAAGFSGPCFVGLIDSQHVVFRFEFEIDFQRMWLKQSWSFRGFTAQMFKWDTSFNPEIESPIAPIWINLPLLPLHCFNKKILFSIASAVGKPLKTDMATSAALQTIRPSIARVCVEADLTKALPDRIWIAKEDSGFWQAIQIEDKQKYCTKCYKLGHLNGDCENPVQLENAARPKQVWLQKGGRPNDQKMNKNPTSLQKSLDKGKSVMSSVKVVPSSLQVSNLESSALNVENVSSSKNTSIPSEVNIPRIIHGADSQAHTSNKEVQNIVGSSRNVVESDKDIVGSSLVDEGNNPSRRIDSRTGPSVEDPVLQSTDGNNLAHFLMLVDENQMNSPDDRSTTALQKCQNELVQQKDEAGHYRTDAVRIPITVDFQKEQETGTSLRPLYKAPSTSHLRQLQLITSESETDFHQYGGSSEWEEETDSVAYMEILHNTKYKPQKKNKKRSVPPSNRKLRSQKQLNVFGYESR